MTHSKTLANREEDLVTAQNTTFDDGIRAEIVRHAANRIKDTLLSCELLATANPEYAAIAAMHKTPLDDCIGE